MARKRTALGRKPKRPVSERRRKQLTEQLRAAGYAGGDMAVVKEARARKKADYEAIRERFTTCDIIEFVTEFLKLDLAGYPLLELILRCSEGLPLPEGRVTTYVEVPSDGFAVEEVTMTWPEYFALCSRGPKVYRPGKPYATVGARVGRRGTKSTAGTVQSLFFATRSKFRQYVRASEVLSIPILATSEDQAQKIITQRCFEVLKDAGLEWLIGGLDPKLHLDRATNDTIPLIVGAEITAFPCNSKKVRGEAAPLVVLDEYAHFAIEGRKKDTDIRSAATGAQAQFPGYRVMLLSTPLAEEGDFYETEQQAAMDPAILFFHAPSWTAAPILYRNNPEYYHNEFRRDPVAFHREFRAEYSKSVSPAFREEDVLAAMVLTGALPYEPGTKYGAGIDQSGLSGNDRFSIVVAGYDPARDLCFEACRRSSSISDLDLIMGMVRRTMTEYHVYDVATDRFAKGYVHAALAKEGIAATVAPPLADLVVQFRQLLVARKMQLSMEQSVKLGLEQTCMVLTEKSHTPSIYHPRSSKGHADEMDALFRAVHQAVSGNWSSPQESAAEAEMRRQRDQEEAEYDPMTWNRRER